MLLAFVKAAAGGSATSGSATGGDAGAR